MSTRESYNRRSPNIGELREGNRTSIKRERQSCSASANEDPSLYTPGLKKLRPNGGKLIKLGNIVLQFKNGKPSIAKVLDAGGGKSLGVSFSEVKDGDKLCDQCDQFFKRYSREGISAYFKKYDIILGDDECLYLTRGGRKRDIDNIIMAFFSDLMRALKSIDKPCFDYYIGPFSGFRDKCGDGIFRNRDGFTYYGFFKGNRFDGYGSLMSTSCIHRGLFCQNYLEGVNEVIDARNHYVGDMRKGYAHGIGWKDDHGRIYTSQFERGKVQGTALRVLNRGDFFFGQYKNGYAYSIGNSSIEGEYTSGKINGYCAQSNANGSLYFGGCASGKPDGYGLSIYPLSRTVYEGDWKDGKWNGEGKRMEYVNGGFRTAEGHFEHNEFVLSNDSFRLCCV